MKQARWIALGQAIFFLGWAGLEEYRRTNVPVVLLETAPVDPRDLLSGKYLRLGYRIAWIEKLPGFPSPPPPRSTLVAVKLAPEMSVGRRVWRAVAVRCPAGGIPIRQDPDKDVWVFGTWTGSRAGVVFGIEKYFFTEGRESEFAGTRSGSFYVEASVTPDGRLAIRRLIH